jgi:hypothetical protein
MRTLAMRSQTEPGYDLAHAIRALDAVFGRWIAGPWLDPIQPEVLDGHCRQRHTRDSEAAQLRRMVETPDSTPKVVVAVVASVMDGVRRVRGWAAGASRGRTFVRHPSRSRTTRADAVAVDPSGERLTCRGLSPP